MRTTLLLLALVGTASAQKMPVTDDPGRIVQLFDLGPTLDRVGQRPARSVAARGGDFAAMRQEHREELVDAIRRFVEPPLTEGDDVTLLGTDRLVALVKPEQAAWIERFLDGLDEADPEERFGALFTMFKLAPDRLSEAFGRDDLGDAFALEVTAETMRRIRRLGDDWHSGPTSTGHLHPWWGEFGAGMPFVTGWRKVPRRTHDEDLVTPIIDKAFDGIEFEISYVPLPDGRIGHVLSGDVQVVDWDSPTATVRVGDRDYETDEPVRAFARFDDTVTTAQRAPVVFGRRVGDVFVLVTFVPTRR